jgi:hypothetical protein
VSEKHQILSEVLWSAAEQRGISRRVFLRLLAAGGMVGFLAACYPKALQLKPTASPVPTLTLVALTATPSIKSTSQRIMDRSFPSIFMENAEAINLTRGFSVEGAHYDLVLPNDDKFKLQWNSPYPGEGVSFILDSLVNGQAIRAGLL